MRRGKTRTLGFHVNGHSKARKGTEIAGVLFVSLALVWFVHSQVERNALADVLWLFYLPSWIVVLTLFGGVHGAPAGSEIPVFVISFTVQNLVLWYVAKWIIRRAKSATREA